jgi:hypothetical protein
MKKQVVLTLLFAFILFNLSIISSVVIEPNNNESNCTPNLVNTSWSEWVNHTICSNINKQTLVREAITYDSSECDLIENKTIYDYMESSCNYCSQDIKENYTSWSKCSQDLIKIRTKSYHDLNYYSCCKVTGLESDCEIDDSAYQSVLETASCKLFNITITNPINEKIYNTKKVNFEVTSTELLSKLEYRDELLKKPIWMQLCTKCMTFNRTLNLYDGMHKLTFKGTSKDTGQYMTEQVSILIDSKKPFIYPPRIRRLGFSNGSFSLNYTEENVKDVILFFDNKQAIKRDCVSGKNKRCEFIVDVTEYHGQVIKYRFRMIDIAGNTVDSPNYTAIIDVVAPKLTKFEYTPEINKIDFNIELEEAYFQDISYIDMLEKEPKWKILCSRLKGNSCIKEQSFRGGTHQLIIKFSDKAGNFITREI